MSEMVRERDGAVLVLRIDRPDRANALTGEVLAGLAKGIVEAETDPGIRAVVLTGTGHRVFCSGLDLKAFADAGPEFGEATAVFTRLCDGDVAVPLVGAANGAAVGGGLEMLLGCDVIVASATAEFALPEARRGLMPGGSGTMLGQRVPLGIALEMAMTGERISAARAHEIGLVNHVVDPDEVLERAVAIAHRIAEAAPLSLAAVKELMRLAVTDPSGFDARRDHWRGVVFASEDGREGATAFAEKRPPVWKGR